MLWSISAKPLYTGFFLLLDNKHQIYVPKKLNGFRRGELCGLSRASQFMKTTYLGIS